MKKLQVAKSNWSCLHYSNGEGVSSSISVHANELLNEKLFERYSKLKYGSLRKDEIQKVNKIVVLRPGNGRKIFASIWSAKEICEKLFDDAIDYGELEKGKEYWPQHQLLEAAIVFLKKAKKEIIMHHDFNDVADKEEVE